MTAWRTETQDYWKRQERRELAAILAGGFIRIAVAAIFFGACLGLGVVACLWIIHFLSP